MPGFFALFAIAAVVAAIRSIQVIQRRNLAWQRAAKQLGITLKASTGLGGLGSRPSMEGRIRGLAVKIDLVSHNDSTFTRYRVRFPPLRLALGIKRQTFFRSLGTKLGLTDIEIGDPVFDEAVVVKGDLPPRVTEFLTPARRLAIRALFEAYPGASISDNQIEVKVKGFEQDPARLVGVLNRILSTATAITGTDPGQEAAAERREAGDLAEAIEELRRDQPPDPWVEFARTQAEVEILHIEGRNQEAAPLADDLAEQAPADEVAAKLQRMASQPQPPPPPEPGTTEASVEPADSASTDAGSPAPKPLGKQGAEAAQHLFDPDNYSFDTMELFESEYRGKLVEWEGTLIRSRSFDRDRELGDGPGIKAVFRLHEVDHGLYQGQGVDAVVGLPPDVLIEPDKRYRFKGTLVACDAVVRNLYVSEAALITT